MKGKTGFSTNTVDRLLVDAAQVVLNYGEVAEKSVFLKFELPPLQADYANIAHKERGAEAPQILMKRPQGI